MSISPQKIFIPLVMVTVFIISGCGQNQQASPPVSKTSVKVMQVLKANAPISYEYSGQVVGKGEVKVQSKVSGKVVEKYITGGQKVNVGQALYKIDARQFEAALLQAKANLAKARTNLNNARLELDRDRTLFKEGAIAEQALTNQQATVEAQRADVEAQEASLLKAQEDLEDAIVYAPMSGRLSIDDVAVGTYVVTGSTTLVTIGAVDPIFVQFSISETEYLKFMNAEIRQSNQQRNVGRPKISLTLADGSVYPYTGRFGEADRALADSTGTLTLRAVFDNPDNILVPGMFARVSITGLFIPGAILVPERAIQQLLGESFVMVANAEDKSEMRTVTLGDKIGSYYVVTSGISEGDMVIVEGLNRLRDGISLDTTIVTPEEMGFSMQANDTLFKADK